MVGKKLPKSFNREALSGGAEPVKRVITSQLSTTLQFNVAALNVAVELFWAADESTQQQPLVHAGSPNPLASFPHMQWIVHMSTQRFTLDSARVSA